MKTTRFTTVGMAVLALCLLLWVILMLAGSGPTRTGPAVKLDDRHCPNCERELPPTARSAEDCPYCKLENGGESPRKRGGGSIVGSDKTVPIVLLSAFVLLLGVHLGVSLRKRAAKYMDETLYLISCAHCARKIRYRPQQIGRAALCPRCRKFLIFPEPEERVRRRLWQKITQW